jgi:hypothetical protein
MARVVFVLRHVGLAPGAGAPAGAVTEMRSEQRLHAADFWMRNPDYLADALLDDHAAGSRPDGADVAREILSSREPEVRRLPMTKWRWGAYEDLDDVLAPLILHGLVAHRATVRADHKVAEHAFWVMPGGVDFSNAMLAAEPDVFGWYRDRAILIAGVARATPGSSLKDRQYQRVEYASTPGMALIPSIADDVRKRLADLDAAQAA